MGCCDGSNEPARGATACVDRWIQTQTHRNGRPQSHTHKIYKNTHKQTHTQKSYIIMIINNPTTTTNNKRTPEKIDKTRDARTGCRPRRGRPPCRVGRSRRRTPAASPPRPRRPTAPDGCWCCCCFFGGVVRGVGLCVMFFFGGGGHAPTHARTSRNVGDTESHSSKRWRCTSETTRRRSGSRKNCSGRTPLCV